MGTTPLKITNQNVETVVAIDPPFTGEKVIIKHIYPLKKYVTETLRSGKTVKMNAIWYNKKGKVRLTSVEGYEEQGFLPTAYTEVGLSDLGIKWGWPKISIGSFKLNLKPSKKGLL